MTMSHPYKHIVGTVYSLFQTLFRQCGTCLSYLRLNDASSFFSIRCEVQFDYGLRQKRSKPLEMRPDSFVSASGKEISVEKAVAANNDIITKKGQVGVYCISLASTYTCFLGRSQGARTRAGFKSSTGTSNNSRRPLGVKVRTSHHRIGQCKMMTSKEYSTLSLASRAFSRAAIR